jgi:hypothetical protein
MYTRYYCSGAFKVIPKRIFLAQSFFKETLSRFLKEYPHCNKLK